MRIGLNISSVFDRNGNHRKFTGIGNYTYNLLEVINKKVEVFPVYQKGITDFFRPSPVPRQRFFPELPSNGFQYLFPRNLFIEIPGKIQVFHTPCHRVPYFKHIPVIATLHDAVPYTHPQWTRAGSLRKLLINSFMRKSIHRATQVITVSHAAKNDIMEYLHVPKEKINVVYNGISREWFSFQSPSFIKTVLSRYKIHKPFFLHAGTLSPRKNIGRILTAYLALPNSIKENYILVFSGPRGWLPKTTFHQILYLQETGKALWIPYSTFDELRALYQAATLLLFPSLAEGFGLPILEGFASQIPVLTSKGGATEEVAADAAYLIDPYSVESLRQGMLELAENVSLREALIKKGRERVTEFSWEKCGEETIAVYSKFC